MPGDTKRMVCKLTKSIYGLKLLVNGITSFIKLSFSSGFEMNMVDVTPQTRGSVDYPSTRGIQVDVGLPDATSDNRAESPLYGELYPNTLPA